MLKAEDLVSQLDEYVLDLRILSIRYVGVDPVKDQPLLLAPDWRTVEWYDALSTFELEGLRACGYAEVLKQREATRYCSPSDFRQVVTATISTSHEKEATWAEEWQRLPNSAIELDPRYVAFRTIWDWAVLLARVVAERSPNQQPDTDFWSKRLDPFARRVRTVDDDGEPVGLLCGNLRERLLGCFFVRALAPDYIRPEWRDVQSSWDEVLRHFHCRGLKLPMELRYGPLRSPADPRLTQFRLLEPETFASYVADVLAKDNRSVAQAWRGRPVENVARDPRFVAHKCGFDKQIILHISREASEAWEDRVTEVDPLFESTGAPSPTFRSVFRQSDDPGFFFDDVEIDDDSAE